MGLSQERQHPFPWKAAAPSLAVSGVLLAVTICAGSALLVYYRATRDSLDRAAQIFNAAVDLDIEIREWRQQLDDYARVGEADTRQLSAARDAALRRITQFERVVSSDGQLDVDAIRQAVSDVDELVGYLAKLDWQSRREQLMDDIRRTLDDQILARTQQQRAEAATTFIQLRHDNDALLRWTGWLLLLLGLAGTGAGVLSGFTVARALHRDLVELSVSVHSAAGSLASLNDDAKIEIEPSGDLQHVQSMVDLLAERIGRVVERLQAAERETLRRDQLAALGQLAAGLAHELRNPLTAIRTLIEAARGAEAKQPLDDRDLEVIDEELTRLDDTLQSFLDYARPPQLRRRETDLRDIVARTVQLVSPRAESQSVKIESQVPPEPLRSEVDPEQIRQVVLNLLLNALDSLARGGRITIGLHDAPSNGHVELSVADDGPGVRDELLGRLFEPFVSSKPSGTGLGLTISRRIAESHGGRLTAENRSEGGARFTLSLPRSNGRPALPET